MRAKAEAEPAVAGAQLPVYRQGSAEATALPDGMAAAVLAAQAFHWFDASAAFREFQRILRPGGHAVLMWNERDSSDPFTDAYGKVIRSAPGAAAVEGPRGKAGEAIFHTSYFADAELKRFTNTQELDEDGLIGRSLSASYAPKEPAAVATFVDALRKVFETHQRNRKVLIHYVTSVYSGRAAPRAESA